MVRKARSTATEHHPRSNHKAHSRSAEHAPSSMAVLVREPTADLMQHAREYARERPEMAALCCFAVGFVMGWKLKPW